MIISIGCGVNCWCKTDDDFTPLMAAVKSNNAAIAGLLLKHGAKTDAKDNLSETALFKAVERKADQALVGLLIEHGADL